MNDNKSNARLAGAVIVVVLAALTYSRNCVWQDNASLWQSVIRQNPHDARAYNNYASSGKAMPIEERIRYFQAGLQINSTNPDLHYNLGRAYAEDQRLHDAVREFEEAFKCFDRTMHCPSSLAEKYKCKKKLEILCVDLGTSYCLLGRIEDAIRAYQVAITFNPDNAFAYYNIGIIYRQQGRIQKARQYLRKAHELDSAQFPAV